MLGDTSSCKPQPVGPARGCLSDPVSAVSAVTTCLRAGAFWSSLPRVEMQAPGPAGLLLLTVAGDLASSIPGRKIQKNASPWVFKHLLGEWGGGWGSNFFQPMPPWGSEPSLASQPALRRGRPVHPSLPFTLQVPQEGVSMLSASPGDRPRVPAGLSTAQPLSCIFHTSFVKRTVITLKESLEKSVQIEKDWKWAPLAAEKTLSILNRPLLGPRVPICSALSISAENCGSLCAYPDNGRLTWRAARLMKDQSFPFLPSTANYFPFNSYC